MRTTPELRGKYYPGYNSDGCSDYEFDSVSTMCGNYTPHRTKCLACHRGLAPFDEDGDLKIAAQLLKITPSQRQTVQHMESVTRRPMHEAEQRRLSG